MRSRSTRACVHSMISLVRLMACKAVTDKRGHGQLCNLANTVHSMISLVRLQPSIDGLQDVGSEVGMQIWSERGAGAVKRALNDLAGAVDGLQVGSRYGQQHEHLVGALHAQGSALGDFACTVNGLPSKQKSLASAVSTLAGCTQCNCLVPGHSLLVLSRHSLHHLKDALKQR